jgi:hypothetical protein
VAESPLAESSACFHLGKMMNIQDDFDHGEDPPEGFTFAQKPSKPVKKESSAGVGLAERSAPSAHAKTSHGLIFNPAKQARAVMTQLWIAGNTMVVIPLLEQPEAAAVASISEFPKEEAAPK